MHRPALLIAALLSLLGVATARATGFVGGDAPSRIPVPARVFTATVEDRAGASITVERVTFDGEVHLASRLGEGTVAVPLERIREVRVEPGPDDGHMVLPMRLTEGDPVTLTVEDDVPCYGEAPFASSRIEIGTVRRATFKGPLDRPRE